MSSQSNHQPMAWNNNQVPSSGVTNNFKPADLVYNGSEEPNMLLSHWSDQVPPGNILREASAYTSDRVYLSRIAAVRPDVVVEVGAGPGLHAVGMISAMPELLAYVGIEPGVASASMLRKNIKTVAHTMLRTNLVIKVVEGAAADSSDLFGMVLSKQHLNSLRTSPLDAEVFFNSPQDQASIVGKGSSTPLSSDYKEVSCHTVSGVILGAGEVNNPRNFDHGLIDSVASAALVMVKVCAPGVTHRVIAGCEDLIDLVAESKDDADGEQELVFVVEAREDWDMRGAVAALSGFGYVPVEASESTLYGGYTAKLFCKASRLDAFTEKWCQ